MAMMYYGGGLSWWAATLMWVGMLAFWALIIWAVYWMLVGVTRRDVGESPNRARRILDERLARCEIDTEEYRRLLDVLTSGNHWTSSVGSSR